MRGDEKGPCVLIDVISGDRNVIKEEAEEILKCRDLVKEIRRVWNVKSEVIIGATGTTLIITNKCTYIKFYIKTLQIAPTCFDPKIILRELRCSLIKSFEKHSQNNSFILTGCCGSMSVIQSILIKYIVKIV